MNGLDPSVITEKRNFPRVREPHVITVWATDPLEAGVITERCIAAAFVGVIETYHHYRDYSLGRTVFEITYPGRTVFEITYPPRAS